MVIDRKNILNVHRMKLKKNYLSCESETSNIYYVIITVNKRCDFNLRRKTKKKNSGTIVN